MMSGKNLIDPALGIRLGSWSLAELFAARLRISWHQPTVRFRQGERVIEDSWSQLAGRTSVVASKLAALGVRQGGCVGIFLPTGYAWAQVDIACLQHGWVTAAYHVAWQTAELAHAIELYRPDVIVYSAAQQSILREALARLDWDIPLLRLSPEGNERIVENSAPPPLDIDWVTAHVPATIVFTSGTGGKSKGVLLSQNAMLQAAYHAYRQLGFDASGSRTLHWLPASHMFGRLGFYLDMLAGTTAHFNQEVENLLQDLSFARPHSLFAVPRMLTRLRHRIEERVQTRAALARWIFRTLHWLGGLAFHLPAEPRLRLQHLFRQLFPAVHAPLGGHLELIVVGGAPVDPEDKRYFEALGIAVREGFGMTETAGVASVQPLREPGALRQGAGRLLPPLNAKLDQQGQLYLKGSSLLSGYVGEAAFDEHGWFATGDIARLGADGSLAIIGRVKDLIIPETGENVSPAKLEALLTRHPWIGDACIIGDRRPCLVALLSLTDAGLRAWRESGSDALRRGLDQLLDVLNPSLPKFERIQACIVLPEGLSTVHGELTATQKMRREVICSRHHTRIEQCYAMLRQRCGRHLFPETIKPVATEFVASGPLTAKERF